MGKFRIGEIEEILLNAFPSIDREIYDGWILNFSNAYTYRANCIYPFYASNYDLKDKIKHCEDQYRELFLPVVYKMTVAVSAELDLLLEDEGYKIVKYVDVMCRSLEDWKETNDYCTNDDYTLVIQDVMDEAWLDGVNQLIEIPYPSMEKVQKKIFHQIHMPLVCVKVMHGDRIIGTGLGVLERKYIGLYAIHVDKDYRCQGIGYDICSYIMSYGKQMGATKAHLQVRQGNDSAFHMYRKLGFDPIYTQWFRMKSWSDSKKIFD